jgi:hypothetical protein
MKADIQFTFKCQDLGEGGQCPDHPNDNFKECCVFCGSLGDCEEEPCSRISQMLHGAENMVVLTDTLRPIVEQRKSK